MEELKVGDYVVSKKNDIRLPYPTLYKIEKIQYLANHGIYEYKLKMISNSNNSDYNPTESSFTFGWGGNKNCLKKITELELFEWLI